MRLAEVPVALLVPGTPPRRTALSQSQHDCAPGDEDGIRIAASERDRAFELHASPAIGQR
jgi:hypothetical protein